MKMLFIAICISLIVFAGAVPPAFKSHLDTMYGRGIGVIAILFVTEVGGWPLGLLTAMTFLILMPATVSEGFDASSVEGFIIEDRRPACGDRSVSLFNRNEDKKSTTDNNRWFIERIQGERPEEIDMDDVVSPSIN